MDKKQREAVALKRFSIISPVLNGQINNQKDYFKETAAAPIDMPYLGTRRYEAKTFETQLCRYRRYGFDGLVNDRRSDKGKHRKISAETGVEIVRERKSNPDMPITVLYEKLISDGVIDPTKVSRPTVYRFIEGMNIKGAFKDDACEKESRRFSHDKVGDLYQADVLYGPHIKIGGKRCPAYLHMIIDDCSRYPMYSQFYLSQNFETLRHCFKEAVQRRGIPRLMYTDNGKIYRSQQFEFICASLGCTLLHSQPFVPQGRGKVERYFRTVRERFLSKIDANEINDLDTLNMMYFKWLEEDYTRKAHSGLGGLSPHDVLMAGVSNLRFVSDRQLLDEIFLYRVSRKIGHDATVQINNILYETEPRFAGKRAEIRYDPEKLGDETTPLGIYHDGKRVGEAHLVRFHDNAHAKRKYPGNRRKAKDGENRKVGSGISFADMMEENRV
jgi:transposase InsO family protein